MRKLKRDLPLILNGFFAGMLLSDTSPEPFTIPRLLYWALLGITIIWYAHNIRNDQKMMNKEEFIQYLLRKKKEAPEPLKVNIIPTRYPDDLIHIRDTDENREIVRSILGDPLYLWDISYIVVNVVDRTWYTDFAYRYLYCDQPEVIDVKELIPILTSH